MPCLGAQSIRMMPAGRESWVWVMDFHGFGLSDCDPRLGRIFLDVSARHYPERLGQFLIVSAPRLFTALWNTLKPLIDPITVAKINFVS